MSYHFVTDNRVFQIRKQGFFMTVRTYFFFNNKITFPGTVAVNVNHPKEILKKKTTQQYDKTLYQCMKILFDVCLSHVERG